MPLDQLVLMPEVDARRALAGESIAMRVLAPVGSYAGCGVLRVLRAQPVDDVVQLVCGYEGYDRLDTVEAKTE